LLLLHLIFAFLLLLFVGVEHSWPPWLQIGWTCPQLGLVAVLSIGLVSGPTAGAVAGLFGAFFAAAAGSLPMGGLFITYIGTGFIAGSLSGRIFSTRIIVAVMVSLAAAAAASIIYLILAPPPQFLPWLRTAALTVISTGLWAIPVYALFRGVAARLMPEADTY